VVEAKMKRVSRNYGNQNFPIFPERHNYRKGIEFIDIE